jgi:hypothetical protein
MDDLTENLGGKPLSEPIISTEPSDGRPKAREKASTEPGESQRSSSRKVKPSHETTPRW